MLQGTYELNFTFQVACPLLTLCFLFPVDVVVFPSMVFHQSVLRDNNLSKPSTSSR